MKAEPQNFFGDSNVHYLAQEKSNSLHGSTQVMNIHYVSVNSNWVHPPGQPRGLAHKNFPGGWDLAFESCPGAGNSTRAGILWKFKVKRFVLVLVLLVINTGCPKNCLKNRKHCIVDFQFKLR